MLIATAVNLCEKHGLPWHVVFEDTTKKYIRIVLVTREGEYQLPLVPSVGYSEWHGNLNAVNSRVDGFILTHILGKKY